MSTFIEALYRAEQARRRHRQATQQTAPTTHYLAASAISPVPITDADTKIPLLDLSNAVRLGHRE